MNIFLLISIAYDYEKNRIVTKSVRGIYTDLQAAKDSVVEFAHFISEAGYFNYILIEQREANVLDAHSHSENETWYEYITTPGENILIKEISKPLPFKRMVNFV